MIPTKIRLISKNCRCVCGDLQGKFHSPLDAFPQRSASAVGLDFDRKSYSWPENHGFSWNPPRHTSFIWRISRSVWTHDYHLFSIELKMVFCFTDWVQSQHCFWCVTYLQYVESVFHMPALLSFDKAGFIGFSSDCWCKWCRCHRALSVVTLCLCMAVSFLKMLQIFTNGIVSPSNSPKIQKKKVLRQYIHNPPETPRNMFIGVCLTWHFNPAFLSPRIGIRKHGQLFLQGNRFPQVWYLPALIVQKSGFYLLIYSKNCILFWRCFLTSTDILYVAWFSGTSPVQSFLASKRPPTFKNSRCKN